MSELTDRGFRPWTGRSDGPGAEHARWHTVVRDPAPMMGDDRGPRTGHGLPPSSVVLVGFASDEGVRRNEGRVGAAAGPGALREALASLSDPGCPVFDAGDIVVDDADLDAGQERLGRVVARTLDARALPVVLGGGHAVAYGSYLGWSPGAARRGERWGILNVDAHFDLRHGPIATSGTPFAQAAAVEAAAGRPFTYAVAGIARASNTRALFDTAQALGVSVLLDEDCTVAAAVAFAGDLVARVDRVHLTIDLDALPAAIAPGVSAPAGIGIGIEVVRDVIRTVVDSGRLGLLEVAELNPTYDIDHRTARTAARLIDGAVRVRATS